MTRDLLATGIGSKSLDPILPTPNLTQTQLDSLCSKNMKSYKEWVSKYIDSQNGEVSEVIHEWHMFASKLAEEKLALKEAGLAEENRLILLNNN